MSREQYDMKSKPERGFSLVEVVLSLGLLAAVLLPTAFLLDLASREAKSGGTASEALAVARSILEEMEGWGFHELHWGYGLNGKAVTYRVDTRKNSHASEWQAALDAELHNAYAIIELNSLSPTGSPPPLESTQAIRITVTVFWQEQQRHRSVQLSATRM
jgi:type II secretory pathway pseudopilin PulG